MFERIKKVSVIFVVSTFFPTLKHWDKLNDFLCLAWSKLDLCKSLGHKLLELVETLWLTQFCHSMSVLNFFLLGLYFYFGYIYWLYSIGVFDCFTPLQGSFKGQGSGIICSWACIRPWCWFLSLLYGFFTFRFMKS